METLVPAAICHHTRIRVATERAMEFIDLTARIEALAAEAGIDTGLVNIQTLHTTTASWTSRACSPGRRRGTRAITTMT